MVLRVFHEVGMSNSKVKLTRKGKRGLYEQFLWMTLLPLLFLGSVILIVSTKSYEAGMQSEVEKSLHNTAKSVLLMYDNIYPGDYSLLLEESSNVGKLQKGEVIISDQFSLIDQIKKESQIDVSLFFYNVRMMTTIKDEKGIRFLGDEAPSRIVQEVIEKGEERFYTNARVNGKLYYAYYLPIYGSDGTCIGMVATKKPASNIVGAIRKSLYLNTMIILLALLLTGYYITYQTRKIVGVIQQLMIQLKSVAKGNLKQNANSSVVLREDELGEIGRSIEYVQSSLKTLIEKDALTGLLNRRSGEKQLDETQSACNNNGTSFAIAIGDIDYFKKVNDQYGHHFGDLVLKSVATLLWDEIRGNGFVARWGGEEFLIVLMGVKAKEPETIIQKILHKLGEMTVCEGENCLAVTMTIGMVLGDPTKPLNLQIREADEKLYKGKEAGRNRLVF